MKRRTYILTAGRGLVAEGLGSILLAATVIGSGIMAERLAGGNLAVALLANAAATVAVLATLIALLGPSSGAHFNPAVSLIEALRGKLTVRQTVAYVIVRSRIKTFARHHKNVGMLPVLDLPYS